MEIKDVQKGFPATDQKRKAMMKSDMIFVKTFTLADFGPVISPESA